MVVLWKNEAAPMVVTAARPKIAKSVLTDREAICVELVGVDNGWYMTYTRKTGGRCCICADNYGVVIKQDTRATGSSAAMRSGSRAY